MKRRRPQWPSVYTLVTVLVSGAAMLVNPCASQELNPFAVNNGLKADDLAEPTQAIVLPSFPPEEEDVSSEPTSPPPPPPTLNPTMWPTVATTESPTVLPTVETKPSPTPWPTVEATLSPTAWPTVEVTPSPTAWPTVEATQSPTVRPTRAPVTQTSEPSISPTTAPTTFPTLFPTTSPTTPPTASTSVPTLSPANQPMISSYPDISITPTSPLVETSLSPFVFTLDIADAQAASGSDDPDAITAEVERILSEFLFQKLSEVNYNGVSLNSIDLNATPRTRRALKANSFERRLRSLQTETLSFDVTGTALSEVAQDSGVTEQGLTNGINAAVMEILEDPNSQEELVQEFQASESEVLSQTVGVSAQVQEPIDDGIGKPSLASMVFGFIIAGIGAVGAGIYLYAFMKKRRKRALKRKQERQGPYEGYGAAVNTTQSTMSANGSLPSPESKVMTLPPAQNEVESSSSSSASFEGVASEESSGSVSDFTRELELAASLDRRTWIDIQGKREAWERNRSAFGASMQYPSHYATTSPHAKGVKVRNASGGEKQVPNISSFPYGDEQDNVDSDSGDLSEVKRNKGEDLFSEGEEGVEWTEVGVWNPYDGYGEQTDRRAVETRTDGALESRGRKHRDSNAYMKSYNNIDTAPDNRQRKRSPENRQRKKRDSSAYMKSWSSIDTARRDSSNPSGEDQETDQAPEALLGVSAESAQSRSTSEIPRMSPTVSSVGTSNAVFMSSTASAGHDVAAEQTSEPSHVKSKEADDSLLTIDVVKEVQRLARFVKRYERKSHKKEQKKLERNDVRSVPSVGYDALSDSISALRKGPPEASPRGQRMIISNAVEESDETEASLTTDRSWSTESRANSGFEDDDEDFSTPLEETEVDVSDSSVGEDISDTASDASRLGITPFSMQKVIVPPKPSSMQKVIVPPTPSPPETSRPPVTGKGKATRLSVETSKPASPDEASPEKTHTPVQNVKRVMRRVSSARQRKSAEKGTHVQSPAKRPHESDLTEDALREISGDGGSIDILSPHQQKGALQSLRTNDAILDTASSIMTDGVTPSQHDRAFEVNEVVPQERTSQISQRFQAKAYGKMQQRAPRDPTPTRPIEGPSPPIQPTLPLHGRVSAEPKAPRATSEMQSPTIQHITPSKSPGNPRPATTTGSRSPYISPFAKPTESAEATTQKSDTGRHHSTYTPPFSKPQASTYQPERTHPVDVPWESRDPPADSPAAMVKDAATHATPTMGYPPATATQMEQEAPPTKTQEMTPAFPYSPPRRIAKTNAAFSSIINMFESKPKEAIFPPNESWQYNC